MDRIKLVYSTEHQDEVELPFRILVLGDFNPNRDPALVAEEEIIDLNRHNFDRILEHLQVSLHLQVPDYMSDIDDIWDLDIVFRSLHDFTPDALLDSIPHFRQWLDLVDHLKRLKADEKSELEVPGAGDRQLLFSMGFDESDLERGQPDLIIAEIQHRMGLQLDAVLSHQAFESLEASWRGLFYLVDHLDPAENCSVEIFSISKDNLLRDVEDSAELFDSLLYKKVYSEELGQFGGKPFGVILADYAFNSRNPDIRLLSYCARLAEACQAPFISAADASFFGLEDYAHLSSLRQVSELLNTSGRYIKWRSFRQKSESRFVGLTLPKIVLRQPYHYLRERIGHIPYFRSSRALFGNSVFGFGVCLLKSFVTYRWCIDIAGKQGGQVPGMIWEKDLDPDGFRFSIPTETAISESMETDLVEAGFIPLKLYKGDQLAVFESANSVKHLAYRNSRNKELELNEYLSIQLPYTFMMCRLSHYIKVIQRDQIGSSKTTQQLEKELNKWLIQYVSDMDNPTKAVRTRRPLRKATIRIKEESENQPWYSMELAITPHFKYLGATFSLSLKGMLESF